MILASFGFFNNIRIGHALDTHKGRQVDEDEKEDIKMEWQLCALVIDRFVKILSVCDVSEDLNICRKLSKSH